MHAPNKLPVEPQFALTLSLLFCYMDYTNNPPSRLFFENKKPPDFLGTGGNTERISIHSVCKISSKRSKPPALMAMSA